MNNIRISLHSQFWTTALDGEQNVRGTAFFRHEMYSKSNFADVLPSPKDSEITWEKTLNELNGFYAIVASYESQLVAAVDRIRSIPLFYGHSGGQFFLSDDAEWVRKQVGDNEMDPVAKEEFQLAGYVTGRATLFSNVKQLQAGEFLVAKDTGAEVEVTCHRYYRFTHTEPEHYDKSTLRQELDDYAVRCIQRLIDYAGGRQIVIPLSGGYDSRLIATLLKHLGYENILSFTYGVPGNKESKVSRNVAESLSIPWHFVEYSKYKWWKACNTEERAHYQRWASGWASLPHMQDWLAVREMKANKVVDDNCVFVPGHSGDFVAGSHIPEEAYDCHNDMNILIHTIVKKHYSLAPLKKLTANTKKFWYKRLQNFFGQLNINNGVDLVNAFEKFDWQERQAKLICNSVRVYEYYEFDWWMPLWDKEFMSYWQKVPLELRKGTQFYVQYALDIYNKNTKKKIPAKDQSNKKSVIFSMTQKIRKNKIIRKYLSPVMSIAVGMKYIFKDDLAFSGRHSQIIIFLLAVMGYKKKGINNFMFLKEFGE